MIENMFGHHISAQYNEELEDLRNRVLNMGGLVEQQIADAVAALVDGDGARWEAIARIRGIGMRLVQHISVNDGCFWAGAEPGRYLLHHNKQAVLRPDRESRAA